MWAGYLAEPSGRRLLAQAAASELPVEHHHSSGHAPLPDLQRLVRAISPARVVPIHTEGAAEYSRHFAGATPQRDGDWWSVAGDVQ